MNNKITINPTEVTTEYDYNIFALHTEQKYYKKIAGYYDDTSISTLLKNGFHLTGWDQSKKEIGYRNPLDDSITKEEIPNIYKFLKYSKTEKVLGVEVCTDVHIEKVKKSWIVNRIYSYRDDEAETPESYEIIPKNDDDILLYDILKMIFIDDLVWNFYNYNRSRMEVYPSSTVSAHDVYTVLCGHGGWKHSPYVTTFKLNRKKFGLDLKVIISVPYGEKNKDVILDRLDDLTIDIFISDETIYLPRLS